MNIPGNIRVRRLARRLFVSALFFPTLYAIVALVASFTLVRWDATAPTTLGLHIDAASAQSAMSALTSGMLAFTGFVTSVVLLIVQFGTSEFSPRLVRWFNSDRTLNLALSTFIATFLFALVTTAQIDTSSGAPPPTRSVIAATVLALLSVLMFLLLIARTQNGLRVAKVVQGVDSAARQVFDTVYPSTRPGAESEGTTVEPQDAPVQTLYSGDVGAVLATLDQDALVALAHQRGALIRMRRAVGDHIPANAPLLDVYGPTKLPEARLRRCVILDDERTIDFDPAFAFRVLVDIAIKALSPAVNDPTTAVQSIDRIEDLLRYAAAKHLSAGAVADRSGTLRLVYPTPTWDDLVELALDEIRQFGTGQYQIARRLRAMLDALLDDLPERRRPALRRQLALLDDAVAAAYPLSQRADALVADSQGIGMARGAASPGKGKGPGDR
ncbi:DUF2254 domain-containing protein [Leifsonia poae]|uniref:DUF2254 domain-containing protein n=1 Tax=Leifsonia poae TaxID=110933 RepID=UPI003D685C1F